MSREITTPTPIVLTSKSYNGKDIIQFNEASHRYKLNGKACVGVTTFVKSGLPTSMGLINWFKDQSVQFTYDWFIERGNVTSITEEERKELFKAARVADKKTSQEAADIGTLVHDVAYLTELNKVNEAARLESQICLLPDESKSKIINGIDKFKAWKKENKDEMVASETLVASPMYMFCGKFDRLARRNDKLILSDFKTSGSIYLDHYVQLGAYSLAISEWLGMKVEGLEVLRFGKEDGEFETLLITDPAEIQVFQEQAIRCRQTHEFLKMGSDPRFDWKKK